MTSENDERPATDDVGAAVTSGTLTARERNLLAGCVSLLDGFLRLDHAVLEGNPGEDVRQVLGRFALLRRKVETLLEKEGVVMVNSLGQPVNPELHEVVDTRTCRDGESPGTIVEVEEQAWMHKGDVLRPGRVIVGE